MLLRSACVIRIARALRSVISQSASGYDFHKRYHIILQICDIEITHHCFLILDEISGAHFLLLPFLDAVKVDNKFLIVVSQYYEGTGSYTP